LDKKLAEIDLQLSDGALYGAASRDKLQALLVEQGQLARQKEQCEADWYQIHEQLETLEAELDCGPGRARSVEHPSPWACRFPQARITKPNSRQEQAPCLMTPLKKVHCATIPIQPPASWQSAPPSPSPMPATWPGPTPPGWPTPVN